MLCLSPQALHLFLVDGWYLGAAKCGSGTCQWLLLSTASAFWKLIQAQVSAALGLSSIHLLARKDVVIRQVIHSCRRLDSVRGLLHWTSPDFTNMFTESAKGSTAKTLPSSSFSLLQISCYCLTYVIVNYLWDLDCCSDKRGSGKDVIILGNNNKRQILYLCQPIWI